MKPPRKTYCMLVPSFLLCVMLMSMLYTPSSIPYKHAPLLLCSIDKDLSGCYKIFAFVTVTEVKIGWN